MNDLERERERLFAHQEEMALHRANGQLAQMGLSAEEKLQLLDTVTKSELDHGDEHASLSNLQAKDIPLSFYSEHVDTHEFKFMSEIIAAFERARFPHPRSGLQGLSRAWAAGDTNDRLRSPELDETARDESYLMGTYSRSTRGEEGAQQDALSKQIVESHAYHDRDDSGGRLNWFGRKSRRDHNQDSFSPQTRKPRDVERN